MHYSSHDTTGSSPADSGSGLDFGIHVNYLPQITSDTTVGSSVSAEGGGDNITAGGTSKQEGGADK